MKPFPLLLGLLVIAAHPARAADLAFTLMPPSATVAAGQAVDVDVVALNPRSTDASFELESTLTGKLRAGAQSWPLTLETAGAAPAVVAPGGFAVRHFRFTVPADARGETILEITRSDGAVLRAVLEVAAVAPASASTPAATAPEPPPTPLDLLHTNVPAASLIARNFAGRFLPNMPVYFIGGGEQPRVKFQVSFDYRLAMMTFGEPGQETASTLRIGYTQRSLWAIGSDSSPFYDTSYMPEVAFNTDAPLPRHGPGVFTWLGMRAGFQHESNGKSGADSRTLNIAYLRPRFVLGQVKGWSCVMLPEVFAYVGGLSENPDLDEYRGYGKLRFYLGKKDGMSLMFTGWTGKDWNHGTYQLDLAVPASLHAVSFDAFFYAQYFDGYGESLLDYKKKSDSFRLGISLVR